ncbi:MAG: DNA recombination protein RmuC [Rickettsiales bacterium]|nr:DNA recombination protein RmuC [Rickettsiales bacterium]
MSILSLILTYSLPAVLISVIIILYRDRKTQNIIVSLQSQCDDQSIKLSEQIEAIDQYQTNEREHQARLNQYIASDAALNTKLDLLEKEALELKQELNHTNNVIAEIQDHKHHIEKENSLLKVKLEDMQVHLDDFEKLRQEHFKSAKEAMFETGTAALRKEAESVTKKTFEGMEHIIKQVASLKDQVKANDQSVNIIKRALETPGGAGYLSEIGLENTLKAYGLEKEKDYKTQFNATGEQGNHLRPDAVVFLPDDHLLVIDSKASKFFLELAELQETQHHETEKLLLEKLKNRMHEHLKTLASKGYKEAVANTLKREKKLQANGVITVLFVHTESAIEKILLADPAFRNKATELGIILSGPTGLAGLLSLSSFVIAQDKREQNQQHIIDEISVFLGYIETALDYAGQVGKGLESISKNYNKFTRSVNSRLLPKAHKINELGVALPKNKKLPHHIREFHIIDGTSSLIEAEAERSVNTSLSKQPEPILESSE